jgi:hypothetical protein
VFKLDATHTALVVPLNMAPITREVSVPLSTITGNARRPTINRKSPKRVTNATAAAEND